MPAQASIADQRDAESAAGGEADDAGQDGDANGAAAHRHGQDGRSDIGHVQLAGRGTGQGRLAFLRPAQRRGQALLRRPLRPRLR